MELLLSQALNANPKAATPDGLGCRAVGASALLDILELYFGLSQPSFSSSERIVAYRDVLSPSNAKGAFFSKSYEADPIGTVKELLRWRDDWYLHGWDGSVIKDGGRLEALSSLEPEAIKAVPICQGQRLRLVEQALKSGAKHPITTLTLVDAIETWPKAWQSVLQLLPTSIWQPDTTQKPTLLNKLHEALTAAVSGTRFDTIDWDDDGSISVWSANTSILSSVWLSDHLASNAADLKNTLLIGETDTVLLDDYFGIHNLPGCGANEKNAFRPSLQVLPLTLGLIWKPLNFYTLIQWLNLPMAPLSKFTRALLAKALVEKTGIGSSTWRAAKEKSLKKYEDKKDELHHQEKIEFWLESERFDPKQGAPISFILDRVQKLAEYFLKQSQNKNEDEIYHSQALAGYRQTCALLKSLTKLIDQQVNTLSNRMLVQLIDEASSHGNANPNRKAEAGGIQLVTKEGAAITKVSHAIWWLAGASSSFLQNYWTFKEINLLRSHGISIPCAEAQIKQQTVEWLRLLCAVEDKLTIVLPPPKNEPHPLWQMIKAVIKDIPVRNIEESLKVKSSDAEAMAAKPLPAIKRYFQFPVAITNQRKGNDSFSSIKTLLNNPAEWVFKYIAKLYPEGAAQIPDEFTIKGKVVHRLVEVLFSENQTQPLSWSNNQLYDWFNKQFDQIIEEEAAIFLMPGKQADLDLFRYQSTKAIERLVSILADAKTICIETERELRGTLNDTPITGYADLVLTLPNNRFVMLDMKLMGKIYPSVIKENRALQLAIYAHLYEQETSKWAEPAYYLVINKQLLTATPHTFPNISVIEKSTNENGKDLLRAATITLDWRKTQLANGIIEVRTEATTDFEEKEPLPIDAYEPDEPNDNYNNYLYLSGWGDQV